MRKTVFITDYAWPDLELERGIIEGAGHVLVAAERAALPGAAIAELAARYRPQAIMTCWAEVSAAAIAHCRDLQIVARYGVGLDNIDCAAARAHGAVVTNVPDYCVEEVSDHAVALLLAWARGIVVWDREVKRGFWDPSVPRLHRVRKLTVGIAGYGRIGRLVARKLSGFGLELLAFSRNKPASDSGEAVEWVDFQTLLARSDAVIALLPLSPETRAIFDAKAFAGMKPGSLLINVSRGGLVDNRALLHALEHGPLDAAALDVIDGEPAPPMEVRAHPKIIVTPHVAFSSPAAIEELRRRTAEEVLRVFNGEAPRNLCPAGSRP